MASAKRSAGILLFRRGTRHPIEILLVHPGGPFWERKDAGVWTIPKGEHEEDEDPLEAARREFEEETSHRPDGRFHPMPPVKQKSGKIVLGWAMEGDFDPAQLRSNTFEVEWPPRSGRKRAFPEVDRAEWFGLEEAAVKIRPEQKPFLDEVRRIASETAR
ncbi:MAG TPA: NUDIX domain-containing protein [Candidatus Eisenbacteria bacterium]|nr:NUDIX domain-containing protein [Candidatus Eisenbacteria bacterium]